MRSVRNESYFSFPSSSNVFILFLNSSMDLFDELSIGLLRESRNADIQRESPFAQLRTMMNMPKLMPTTAMIKSKAAITVRDDSIKLQKGRAGL